MSTVREGMARAVQPGYAAALATAVTELDAARGDAPPLAYREAGNLADTARNLTHMPAPEDAFRTAYAALTLATQAIALYASLPTDYAENRAIDAEGRTSKDRLIVLLTGLTGRVESVVESVAQPRARALASIADHADSLPAYEPTTTPPARPSPSLRPGPSPVAVLVLAASLVLGVGAAWTHCTSTDTPAGSAHVTQEP